MKKLLIIIIMVLFLTMNMLPEIKAEASTKTFENKPSFRDTTYVNVYNRWLENYHVITTKDIIVKASSMKDINNVLMIHDDLYQNDVFSPLLNDSVQYEVIVPQTGLYHLGIDYFLNNTFSVNPQLQIKVNNEIPFNELSKIEMNVLYLSEKLEEVNRYNRYGDELIPSSIPVNKWYHNDLSDTLGKEEEPFYILLNKGINTIDVTVLCDNLYLGDMTISSTKQLNTYNEYIKKYQNEKIVSNDNYIEIQAENFNYKNNIEVKASYYKSVSMVPNSYKTKVLNMLDGTSLALGGSKVIYDIYANESGLYNIAFKYKQDTIKGLAVGKQIEIDGEVLYSELNNYLFPSTTNWENYYLQTKDGTKLSIYLEEGHHTISITSSSSHATDAINELYEVMDWINTLGLNIKSITGSSTNTQIDWDITKYLPTIASDLQEQAYKLEQVYDYFNELNSSSNKASEISTLIMAKEQLLRLSNKPNKISSRLSELCDGSGSSYQLIGNAIGVLTNETMDIDYLYLCNSDYKLPNALGNIFKRIFFSIKSFIYSFIDKRYKITSREDNDTLEVWVAQSSLYINIMQNMIDENFTKKTGIKVRLNVLPSTQKIVLNNATDTNPDLVLSIDSWEPYTYALRGMLEDLSSYPNFEDITSNIYASNFTPLIFEDGVYGIPETQGMQLLFYRTDILNYLNLEVPNTWDDVLKMLPILQSYQMNYYHPLGAEGAYKGFGVTSQFFYLFNAEMYSENGFTSVLNKEEAINAVTYMTNLFNIYNLPKQVSSFFEHFRSGTIPIGLGGIDLYLQLKYACPELAGQWDVAMIPGMLNEQTNEVERWASTYGKCSIMFSQSKKKDDAWRFLTWWHDTQTQIEYVRNIKMNLGERFLIVPANIDSLENSLWDDTIKQAIIKQARFSRIPAITPGSYIVEREISNIWNEVVIDKMNVRVAINASIPRINRELKRKFEEFKYLENGQIIKEYVVPTNENINRWIKKARGVNNE